MKLKGFLLSFVNRLFNKKRVFRLGIYGPPNAGKTSIANFISKEWTGEEMGTVSKVPHETREVSVKEKVLIQKDGKKIEINLIDTPGISTKVDFEEFLKYGVKKNEAKNRAREATKGIIEAIKWLDDMDVVLAVMDSTKDPYTQVNITILGNLEVRKIPVIVVANKTDLKTSRVKRVSTAFPQYKVVGLSASQGNGFKELYDALFDITKEVKR
ncbi:MAG TPA: Era-like GTP-binding protein [Candidatus Nanoarchaeia archaeon]|nr:Era-like GTP-binding protein [Candidatus Nanoarchaeia archaeon]